MTKKRPKGGKFKRVLAISAMIVLGLAVGLLVFGGLLITPGDGTNATGPPWTIFAGFASISVTILVLVFAGSTGRVENQRILERPFDERERNIRGKALGAAFTSMMVVCLGWLVLAIIEHKSVTEPLLLLLLGVAAVTTSIDLFRRRG